MYKLLVIAPYTKLVAVIEGMKDLFQPHQLIVRVGTFDDVRPCLEDAASAGIDVIVARGATAQLARNISPVPVVETVPSQLDVCLFVACNIGNVAIEQLSKEVLPWLFALIAVLILISFMPELVLWIPNAMM